MERDEPPPMTSEVTLEAKKDIFDDDEDDELFKSAINNKLESKSIYFKAINSFKGGACWLKCANFPCNTSAS